MLVFFGLLWAAGNALLVGPLFAKHVHRGQVSSLMTYWAVLVLTPAMLTVQVNAFLDVGWYGLIFTPMVVLGLLMARLLWRGAGFLGR